MFKRCGGACQMLTYQGYLVRDFLSVWDVAATALSRIEPQLIHDAVQKRMGASQV
jgi:hypothetical protein